jgi:hypothetical protein
LSGEMTGRAWPPSAGHARPAASLLFAIKTRYKIPDRKPVTAPTQCGSPDIRNYPQACAMAPEFLGDRELSADQLERCVASWSHSTTSMKCQTRCGRSLNATGRTLLRS